MVSKLNYSYSKTSRDRSAPPTLKNRNEINFKLYMSAYDLIIFSHINLDRPYGFKGVFCDFHLLISL